MSATVFLYVPMLARATSFAHGGFLRHKVVMNKVLYCLALVFAKDSCPHVGGGWANHANEMPILVVDVIRHSAIPRTKRISRRHAARC